MYKTVILPTIFSAARNWVSHSKEECKLRVFESRVLRRAGPKRGEVTRG
jgi:hypothetical protein